MKDKLEQLGRRELSNYNNAQLVKYISTPTWVYYARILMKDRVYYKIGCSINIEKRLLDISKDNPGSLIELISSVRFESSIPAYEHEKKVKWKFKCYTVGLKAYQPFNTCLTEIFSCDVLELDNG